MESVLPFITSPAKPATIRTPATGVAICLSLGLATILGGFIYVCIWRRRNRHRFDETTDREAPAEQSATDRAKAAWLAMNPERLWRKELRQELEADSREAFDTAKEEKELAARDG